VILYVQLEIVKIPNAVVATMGVNATGTLGRGRRSSAEDARIESP